MPFIISRRPPPDQGAPATPRLILPLVVGVAAMAMPAHSAQQRHAHIVAPRPVALSAPAAAPTVTPPRPIIIQARQRSRPLRSGEVIAPRPQTLYVPRVTFDAATLGGGTTFSHTCTGANRYLTVGVAIGGTTVNVTGITYAGVAMQKLQRSLGSTLSSELWGLANPASGSNSVVISLSGAAGTAQGAISFVNAAQTGQPGQVGATSGTGTTLTSASLWSPYGSMLADVVGGNSANTIQTGTQAWNDGGGDSQGYLQSEGVFANTSWTGASQNWAISAGIVLPVGFSASKPAQTIVEPSISTTRIQRRRGSVLAPRPASLAVPQSAPTVTPPRLFVVLADRRHEARGVHGSTIYTVRSSALTNHAILQAGSPQTLHVQRAAASPPRQKHPGEVVEPRPAALANHAILDAGQPRTIQVVDTRAAPRQRHQGAVVEPRPQGLIFTPAAGVTTPPRTTWVVEAHPPRLVRHSAVLAPRSQGLIFTPAAPAANPPKTVTVVTARTPRRVLRARIAAPRPLFAPVTPPKPVVAGRGGSTVQVRARLRRPFSAILAPLRQRLAVPSGVQPTLITTPATAYVTVEATAVPGQVADTAPVTIAATGVPTTQNVTGLPTQSYAPSGVCPLGYSNQVLGGVVVGDVETLIGRQFHGLRQNQAYTTTGIGTAITEFDAGRTHQYRSIQVDTLPGGWGAVITGNADAQFTTFATNVMANPTRWNPSNPFIVAFSHEASLDLGTLGTAQQYIDAFRHVRDLFDAMGATVRSKTGTFLGGPIQMAYVGWDRMYVGANGIGPPTAGQGVDDLDPDKGSSPAPVGTSYYELIGSDVYNAIDSPGVYRYSTNAHLLLDPIISAAVSRNKDWMIGEMGAEDGATTQDHQNKAAWLDSLRTVIDATGTTSPGVCRFMFTTIKASAENYNVDSSAESIAAWKRLGNDSYYG